MQLSPERNAVVLMIDRLGTNMLGAYGSTWFETENFNRLAAESLLFDHCIASTSDLAMAYRGLWNLRTGAIDNQGLADNTLTLPGSLSQRGQHTVLITDEPLLLRGKSVASDAALSDAFGEVIWVGSEKPEQAPAANRSLASSIEQTELARFFAAAVERISDLEPGVLVWLHCRALNGAWDAPYEYRQRLAHSDDPDPPHFSQSPQAIFCPDEDDPDELLGYQQACAAQVAMIDDFLGVILDLRGSDRGWANTLFCLGSPRGFPLGEHGFVGHQETDRPQHSAAAVKKTDLHRWAAATYNEALHVPLMACLPRGKTFHDDRAIRSGHLIQPAWLGKLIFDWFSPDNTSANGEPAVEPAMVKRWQSVSYRLPNKVENFVFSISDEAIAIQTHAWKFIRQLGGQLGDTPLAAELLFVKPDDRWEVNDVSQRCREVVEAFDLAIVDWLSLVSKDIPDPSKLAGQPRLTATALRQAAASGVPLVLSEFLTLPLR